MEIKKVESNKPIDIKNFDSSKFVADADDINVTKANSATQAVEEIDFNEEEYFGSVSEKEYEKTVEIYKKDVDIEQKRAEKELKYVEEQLAVLKWMTEIEPGQAKEHQLTGQALGYDKLSQEIKKEYDTPEKLNKYKQSLEEDKIVFNCSIYKYEQLKKSAKYENLKYLKDYQEFEVTTQHQQEEMDKKFDKEYSKKSRMVEVDSTYYTDGELALLIEVNDEESIKIYNYLYEKKGKSAADKYLSDIKDQLHEQAGQKRAEKFLSELKKNEEGNYSNYGLTLNQLKTTAKGLSKGWDSFFDGLTAWTEKDKIYSTDEYEVMYIMQGLSEDESFLNVLDNNFEISQSIGNMLPSIIVSKGISPLLGTTLMGVSAGGNSYHQARVSGKSTSASVSYGVLSGLSEATLQHFLGAIPGMNDIEIKSFQDLLRSMGKEGFEEFTQTYVDASLQTAVLNEEQDLSEVTKDAGKSFIYGAIISGILNTPQATKNIKTKSAQKKETENIESSSTNKITKNEDLKESATESPSTDNEQWTIYDQAKINRANEIKKLNNESKEKNDEIFEERLKIIEQSDSARFSFESDKNKLETAFKQEQSKLLKQMNDEILKLDKTSYEFEKKSKEIKEKYTKIIKEVESQIDFIMQDIKSEYDSKVSQLSEQQAKLNNSQDQNYTNYIHIKENLSTIANHKFNLKRKLTLKSMLKNQVAPYDEEGGFYVPYTVKEIPGLIIKFGTGFVKADGKKFKPFQANNNFDININANDILNALYNVYKNAPSLLENVRSIEVFDFDTSPNNWTIAQATKNGKTVKIYPLESQERVESDLFHELGHSIDATKKISSNEWAEAFVKENENYSKRTSFDNYAKNSLEKNGNFREDFAIAIEEVRAFGFANYSEIHPEKAKILKKYFPDLCKNYNTVSSDLWYQSSKVIGDLNKKISNCSTALQNTQITPQVLKNPVNKENYREYLQKWENYIINIFKEYSSSDSRKFLNKENINLVSRKINYLFDQVNQHKFYIESANDNVKSNGNQFVAVSDFHGIKEALSKINRYRSEGKNVFILGDAIDRGKTGDGSGTIELINEIMKKSQNDESIVYVPGNHDENLYKILTGDKEAEGFYKANKQEGTLKDIEKLDSRSKNELANWLGNLPLQRVYTDNKLKTYGMAHAFFDQQLYDYNPNYSLKNYVAETNPDIKSRVYNILWFRKDGSKMNYNQNAVPKDKKIVIGHTPPNSRKTNDLSLINNNGERVDVFCVDNGICSQAKINNYVDMLKYIGDEIIEHTVLIID